MEKSSRYTVKFSGLKTGDHTFDLNIDDSFFEKFDFAQTKSAQIQVKLLLNKQPNMLTLNFNLDGWIATACDRCNVAYRQKLNGTFRVFVKFGNAFEELSDDLIAIPTGAYEIDVSQLIYEFIRLSIPLRKVPCEESSDTSICDVEVLNALDTLKSELLEDGSLRSALNEVKDKLKEN